MIASYRSFLLLESIVKYLPDFRDILRMMSSPIAKELLNLQGQDLDTLSNYIGVFGEDSVTFVPAKKSSSVKPLFKIVQTSGIVWADDNAFAIAKESGYSKLDKPVLGDLCYLHQKLDPQVIKKHSPKWNDWSAYGIGIYRSEDQMRDYMIFDPNVRMCLEETSKILGDIKPQSIKVGRFSKKMLELVGKKFKDKDIEDFVNEFKSKVEISKDAFRGFELVSGEDIVKWYNEENYSRENTSTLHSSCMRYGDCDQYFNIYTQNPDVCKLLIKKSDFDKGKITARALVWKMRNGDHFMDRVYYSKDSEVLLFREYAIREGWVYKKNQSTGSNFIMMGDSSYAKDLEVKLEKWIFKKYPYLDTIPYLGDDGVLRTERRDSDCKELTQTDGSFTQGCEYCEDGYNQCQECDGNGYHDCWKCGGGGKIECVECDGDGSVNCPDCDGDGKDSEGVECENCEGKGKIECGDCDGEGDAECPECDGNGNVTCEYCEDGRVPCSECN